MRQQRIPERFTAFHCFNVLLACHQSRLDATVREIRRRGGYLWATLSVLFVSSVCSVLMVYGLAWEAISAFTANIITYL
ncbi:hypothetical protein BDV11DRAFT_27977 [Aspergillus similis]